MIIECFGVPGAGKSTVTRLLEKKIGAKIVPKQVSKRFSFIFICKHPFFFMWWCLILFRECRATNSWRFFRFKLSVFLTTIGRIQFAYSTYSSTDIVALDEGLIQRVFSLYESKQAAETYHSIFKRLPATSHFVFQVEYTGNIYESGRVGTWRSQLGEVYKKQWRGVMHHNFYSMKTALPSLSVTVISYERDEKDTRFDSLLEYLQTSEYNSEL